MCLQPGDSVTDSEHTADTAVPGTMSHSVTVTVTEDWWSGLGLCFAYAMVQSQRRNCHSQVTAQSWANAGVWTNVFLMSLPKDTGTVG